MFRKSMKSVVYLVTIFVIFGLLVPSVYSADAKLGYVDLRRAFYEYEKAKKLETELTTLTENRQEERTKMVESITKLRDEAELLSGNARKKKQSKIDAELVKLQELDRQSRQEILTKRNDMFREVVDDIQKVVEEIGERDKYDYVFDSRNIMYAKKNFDLTGKVLKQLNKK